MQNKTVQFWISWILLTLTGYTIAILILLPLAIQFAYAGQWPFIIGLASGGVMGGAVGTGQWLLLRRSTPITAAWVGASIAGGMIGMALGMALEPRSMPSASDDVTRETTKMVIPWLVAWQTSVAGALFGVGIGLGQWWSLRRYARSAYWWIFANGVAWMVGLGIGAALAELISTQGALLVTGLIVAIITARVMERWLWEMRKRRGPIPGR